MLGYKLGRNRYKHFIYFLLCTSRSTIFELKSLVGKIEVDIPTYSVLKSYTETKNRNNKLCQAQVKHIALAWIYF